jgi:lipoate-protein ligase A
VLDAGAVSGLRSQSLWHGIAAAMAPDAEPTLSLCRPTEAYVSIGYHRRLDELDAAACEAERLPILRRRIGGGPVLIDERQLFFQITLPTNRAPAGVERLYAELLEPAAQALRTLGLDARVDGPGDLAVGERKLSGTGAGQIGEAVVVVGNVIFDFDHERMARVLALPDERMRAECLRLMRRHVSSLRQEGLGDLTRAEAAHALKTAYAERFGAPREDAPSEAERAAIARWEARLTDPGWQRGPDLPTRSARRVKVRSDVFVVHGEHDGLRVQASVVGEAIVRARAEAPRLAEALIGAVSSLAQRLEPLGEQGRSALAALTPALEARW